MIWLVNLVPNLQWDKRAFFFFKGWNCRLTQSRLVNNRSRMFIFFVFVLRTQGRAQSTLNFYASMFLSAPFLSLSLLVHFSVRDKTLQPHYRISIKSRALACKQCCLCLFPASKSAHFLSPRSRHFLAFSGLVDISQNGFDLTSAGRKKKARNKKKKHWKRNTCTNLQPFYRRVCFSWQRTQWPRW